MRKLSIFGLLTLCFNLSAMAMNAEVSEDAKASIWVQMFGEVSESEMNLSNYSYEMARIRQNHADVSQNEQLAKIWQYNGVLPMFGEGYFLLSTQSATELGTKCLRDVANDAFCLVAYSPVREHYNNQSLGEKASRRPLIQTQTQLKQLDVAAIDALQESIDELIQKISKEVSNETFPPLHYQYLGMLKGYLEGLVAHSSINTNVELSEALDPKLQMEKEDGIVTIKFDAFFDALGTANDTVGNNLYYRIARYLEQNLEASDRIVIDLRGNGGGYMSIALQLAQLFLPASFSNQGAPALASYVTQSGKVEPLSNGFVPAANYDQNPMAILVDDKTGSAAEIFTSIMQSQGHVVIGNQTYGKATVQRPLKLLGNKFTMRVTARFFTTLGGQFLQGMGVTPTLKFPLSESASRKSFTERDHANALVAKSLTTRNSKVEMSATTLSCAQGIAKQRGAGALNDGEAEVIAKRVLKDCYNGNGAMVSGLAR